MPTVVEEFQRSLSGCCRLAEKVERGDVTIEVSSRAEGGVTILIVPSDDLLLNNLRSMGPSTTSIFDALFEVRGVLHQAILRTDWRQIASQMTTWPKAG